MKNIFSLLTVITISLICCKTYASEENYRPSHPDPKILLGFGRVFKLSTIQEEARVELELEELNKKRTTSNLPTLSAKAKSEEQRS